MIYVVIIAAILIFWLVAIDRPTLKVSFKAGHIESCKGHFPAKFKHNVLEIAENQPFDGEFKVYRQRTGHKLSFSKSVPKKVQQRIRNVFPHQGFASKGNKKA
ncbi:DUF3634 family protein [Vibrio renipiscarius]|uniref:DUF3634 domain-containing protein n=1 Tax=Vibrio renipiscarius TaxID=1461322 RepID=A0A0C2NHL8_9VIBR|nr:DUF3634 family protein [Vibrio renipiscarius]KII75855.1 hypothetical protein PL18_19370 [Vibrio renipiscarius]KII81695.1 hypothetical protein OJ16_00365 [Vibrio renipiscarius]